MLKTAVSSADIVERSVVEYLNHHVGAASSRELLYSRTHCDSIMPISRTPGCGPFHHISGPFGAIRPRVYILKSQ